jgi:hypothetical protein
LVPNNVSRKATLQGAFVFLLNEQTLFGIKGMANTVQPIADPFRSETAIMSDVVHIIPGDGCSLKTICDRPSREHGLTAQVESMLHPGEPLFRDIGNEPPVDEHCRRTVMPDKMEWEKLKRDVTVRE